MKKRNELISRVETFLDRSLNLWATNGYDHEQGGFVEALDFEASPLYHLNKRFRVQARQIYVYALAAALGYGDHYLSLVEKGFAFAKDHYWSEKGGGWVMAIDRAGSVVDRYRYAYEQAFMVLALSELIPLAKNSIYQTSLDETWRFLEERLLDKHHGGFNLAEPNNQPLPRQQNPHMHLFEACLHAFKKTGLKIWLERAKGLYELFTHYFFDANEGCLREFFTLDWQPDLQVGDEIEPGHHYEWVWLLGEYKKLSGQQTPKQETLYRYANQYGRDDATFAFDQTLLRGKKLRLTKRLWVQTEVLKAHITMFEKSKDSAIEELIHQHLENIFSKYLIEDKGNWFDQLDKRDKNISVHSPASSFYHLFLSFIEYLRVFKKAAF